MKSSNSSATRKFVVFHPGGYIETVELSELPGETVSRLSDNEGRVLARMTDTGSSCLISFGDNDEGVTLRYDQLDFVCSLYRAGKLASANEAEVEDEGTRVYEIARVEELVSVDTRESPSWKETGK